MCSLALQVGLPHPPPPPPLLWVTEYLVKVSFKSCEQQRGQLRAGASCQYLSYLGCPPTLSHVLCWTVPSQINSFPHSLDLSFPSTWQILSISSVQGHKPEVRGEEVASSGKPVAFSFPVVEAEHGAPAKQALYHRATPLPNSLPLP